MASTNGSVLDGASVWITGGSAGIGAELARLLARDHRASVMVSARGGEALDAMRSERIKVHAVDVTDRDDVERAAAAVIQQLGGIDVAVFAAGIFRRATIDKGFDVDGIREQLETNFMGMVHGVAAVLPHMQAAGRGHIVGLASVGGFRGVPTIPGYSSSKAAVIALLESLRIELAHVGSNVRVHTVCPGFVDTPMTRAQSFTKPLMIPVARAATAIARGIESDKAEIVFPPSVMLAAKAARFLPTGAWDKVGSLLAKKLEN